MTCKLYQLIEGTFLWKNHAGIGHQKLVTGPFFGLNNPKQPLCARTSFKNKVIRYFERILFEILEKVYSALPRDFFAIPLVTYLVKY